MQSRGGAEAQEQKAPIKDELAARERKDRKRDKLGGDSGLRLRLRSGVKATKPLALGKDRDSPFIENNSFSGLILAEPWLPSTLRRP
jgi:hypothetical protein